MTEHRYWPFYCEENVWWLCQEPRFADFRRWVVLVTSAARACALLHQRAAPEGELVVWDYHALLVVELPDGPAEAWDLDSRLGLPVPLERYLDATFRPLPDRSLTPMFRVVEAAAFIERFATDRSHMRDAAGRWAHPPPPWPPPCAAGETMNLPRFLDLDEPIAGDVVDLAALRARFSR